MRWARILGLRLRSLFRREDVDRELEEELHFHFDRQVEQNVAAGMSPEDARAAALRAFGGLAQRKDECRDERRTHMLENFFEDCHYAARNLRHDPFLALTATLALALCIGANTTVFSVADSILIRPLPYPRSDRIDWISERAGPGQQDIGAAPDYFALRDQNRIFSDVGAFQPTVVTLTGVERPEKLEAASVSPSFFRVMATQPLLGRYFADGEEGPKVSPMVVLSYEFWRNRMGSDPQVLGKTISLDRLPRTIVGVMPQGFDFPHGAQLWGPAFLLDQASQQFPILPDKPILIVSMLARRKPDVTPVAASTEMKRLSLAIRALYPQEMRKNGFRSDLVIDATPLQNYLAGPVRSSLIVLTGSVALVLLIACANIANLLLARAGSRQRELAVRMALGSGRGRIVRQVLTESLVLAIPGGAAGIGLAWLAVHVLNAAKPAILVRYPPISMDWRVLAFTIALMLATSLVFGIIPALSASGIHIQDALKSAGLTQSAGRGATRLRKILVVAELGVSLVLLIGAGLLARSFLRMIHVQLGFPSDHLLTFRVDPVGYSFDRNYGPFYTEVLGRLQHLPMVRSAALVDDIPLNDNAYPVTAAIGVVGGPSVPLAERPRVGTNAVSPEFFQTMGIALRSGRIFNSHDFVGMPPGPRPGLLHREAVVVNENFVRRIFPGEDPLGRQLLFGQDELNIRWTIVGVVSDIRNTAIGDPPPMIYRCTCGASQFRLGFLVRTAGPPETAIRAVEQQVRAVDRDQPVSDVKTMDQRRDDALAPERFQLMLLASFAVIAILLAAAGVYGTTSYLVARRTREIGIRMAMGARPADVLGMILGETSTLVALAIVAGLGGAWALTRYIRSMLYGVTALDPATFAVTSVLLAAIVLIASLGPVRRAARVDPITALRDE
jgi:putative ABC transport system permease protein